MRPTNRLLGMALAVMAAVAVVGGGVVGGGVAAGRQGPQAQSGSQAAPLTGSPPGGTPTRSASPATKSGVTPTARPSTPVARPATSDQLPTRVQLDLSRLPTGRRPQLDYRVGRVISGGAGEELTVPGTQDILDAVRFNGGALLILRTRNGSELVRLALYSDKFQPERIAGVHSLVTSPDAERAAYATNNRVYWEAGNDTHPRRVLRPSRFVARVLAVRGDVVYFESAGQGSAPNTVTSWHSATGKVTTVRSISSMQSLNTAGTAAGNQLGGSGQVTCSALVDLTAGTRRWRTCEYVLNGFTPDDKTVIATGNGGEPSTVALDTSTGDLRRAWNGPEILGTAPEDDDHVLLVAHEYDSGAQVTTGAIIRCAIRTRVCQLATPLAEHERFELVLL